MEKSCRKCVPKPSPISLFYLVNNPKQALHGNFLKKRYFERGLSKTF